MDFEPTGSNTDSPSTSPAARRPSLSSLFFPFRTFSLSPPAAVTVGVKPGIVDYHKGSLFYGQLGWGPSSYLGTWCSPYREYRCSVEVSCMHACIIHVNVIVLLIQKKCNCPRSGSDVTEPICMGQDLDLNFS